MSQADADLRRGCEKRESKLSGLVQALDRFFYPGVADFWDDSLFRERLLRVILTQHVVLDLGAGCGNVAQMNFRGRCAAVCGLDPDPSVLDNPYLDLAKVGSGEAIPWPDSSFDVVFSDNVLEHLADPARVFAEIRRVLKPGGVFLFKTPNQFHYVTLASKLTPHWFHVAFNKLRGRRETDTFPTVYRANSRSQLFRLAKAAGLSASIEHVEGRPEYLRVLPLFYPLGIIWERVVNRFRLLSQLRVILIGEFRA